MNHLLTDKLISLAHQATKTLAAVERYYVTAEKLAEASLPTVEAAARNAERLSP